MREWANHYINKPPVWARPDLDAASELGIVCAFLCNEGTGAPVELMTQAQTTTASSHWPSWVVGRIGIGVSNGYCQYGFIPVATWPMSFSAWVNTTGVPNGLLLALAVGTTTKIEAGVISSKWFSYNNLASINTVATVAGWQHFAAVFTASAMTQYVNGVQVATTATSSTFPAGLTTVTLGALATGAEPWTGQIESALVHNIALSQDQVQQLYTDPYWWVQQPNYRRWFPNGAMPPIWASQMYADTSMIDMSKDAIAY